MKTVDLNLLVALDVLLRERSVTAAAKQLGLSPSAMSRTLARLRLATGDPLLVLAGRSLVPTPHAENLRDRVQVLTQDVRAVLRPASPSLDLQELKRTFTIRANEGFVDLFAAPLVAAITKAAPKVRLRFAPKPDKDPAALRQGAVDLEVGVLGSSAPEVRTQLILRDGFVGAARHGHPLLSAPVTPERYAACKHVVASRRGVEAGPVDDALRALGLKREIAVIVPGFPEAVRIAAKSDLIALVPRSWLTSRLSQEGVREFELPVRTPDIAISAMWHPRQDADSAHRWLRETLVTVCCATVSFRG